MNKNAWGCALRAKKQLCRKRPCAGARMCQDTFFWFFWSEAFIISERKGEKDEDHIKRQFCQRICEPDVHHRYCKDTSAKAHEKVVRSGEVDGEKKISVP